MTYIMSRALGEAGMERYQSTRRIIAHQEPELVETFSHSGSTVPSDGTNVVFWRIPREWNERADEFAKAIARGREVPNFSVIVPKGPKSVDFRPISEYQFLCRVESHSTLPGWSHCIFILMHVQKLSISKEFGCWVAGVFATYPLICENLL